MPEFKITVNVDDEFINDILVTAVEGGINYWAAFGEVNYTPEHTSIINATIYDKEAVFNNEEPDWEPTVIDAATVVKGITALTTGAVHVADFIMGYINGGLAESDAGMIDAIAADSIIQAAVFGELVYG